jgi:hypothetical protein
MDREPFSKHALKTFDGGINKNSPKKPMRLNQIGAKFREDPDKSIDGVSRNPYQATMRYASIDANNTTADGS